MASFPLCLRSVQVKFRCDEGRTEEEMSTNPRNASGVQNQLIPGPDAKASLQK